MQIALANGCIYGSSLDRNLNCGQYRPTTFSSDKSKTTELLLKDIAHDFKRLDITRPYFDICGRKLLSSVKEK